MLGYRILAATLIARSAAVLGGVLFTVLVARTIGSAGLGQFTLFVSLLGILSILARYGQDMILVRVIGKLEMSGSGAVALLERSVLRSVIPSLSLGILGSIVISSGWFGAIFPAAKYLLPPALLLFTGLSLMAGYLKGLSRSWVAPFFEAGGVMLVASFFLGVSSLMVGDLPVEAAIDSFFVGLVVLVLIALLILRSDLRKTVATRKVGVVNYTEEDSRSGRVGYTISALSGYAVLSGSFVLAAPFLSDKEIGLLRAAERLALVVSFSLLIINPIVMPKIARMANGLQKVALGRLVKKAIVLTGVSGGVVLLPLLMIPEFFLSAMGSGFVEAKGYLRIMAGTQFVISALGVFVPLLNMSGNENRVAWINALCLVGMLLLVPALSYRFGGYGFALAYSVVNVLRVMLLGLASWRSGVYRGGCC